MNQERIDPNDLMDERPGLLHPGQGGQTTPARTSQPRPRPTQAKRLGSLTWTLLVVVVALLGALAWVFVSAHQDRQANQDATLIAQRQAEAARRGMDQAIERASRQADALRADLQRARDELEVRAEQLQASQARADKLASQVKANSETLAAARGSQSGLAEQLAQTQQKLAAADEDVTTKTEQLAEAQAREAEVATKLATVRKDFALEISRLRQMRDDAVSQLQAARAAMGRMVAQELLTEAAFAQAYLSAAAPGETGIRACQLATKARLLDQGAKLRESIGENAAQQGLLDRLEAALTRLAMLDVADTATVRAFQAMIAEENLSGQIDDVLVGAGVSPELRAWLFEARLVVKGASRAR